jgi:hypothetical protein
MDPTVVKELATRTAEIATQPQLIDAVNKKAGNKVTDLATARHFLEKSNLVASGGRFTRGELFSALMKLSLLLQGRTRYAPWHTSGSRSMMRWRGTSRMPQQKRSEWRCPRS